MIKSFIILLSLITLASCTHSVHLVNVGDFGNYEKITSGEVVRSEADQFVIFGFTRDTSYTDLAHQRLIEQCPDGNLSGITSRLSTSHGFFSWTNKLVMHGLCVQ